VLTSNDASDAHCNWNSDYWRELAAPWGGLLTTASDYSHFLQSEPTTDSSTQSELTALQTLTPLTPQPAPRHCCDACGAGYDSLIPLHDGCIAAGFVYGGALPSGPGVRILQQESARQMSATDQTSAMPGMSPAAASEESYGLGWRRNQGSLSRSAPGMWGGHLEGEADGAGAAWEASVVFGHGGATGATAFAEPVSGISCVLLTTDPSLGESGVVRELSGMVLAAGRESSAVFAALGVRTHAALLVTLLPPSLLTVAKWPNVVDIVHCPPSIVCSQGGLSTRLTRCVDGVARRISCGSFRTRTIAGRLKEQPGCRGSRRPCELQLVASSYT
jgi:hypothetical protein